ncbi:L-2-amino-thiazoline-4-carboxylic acid hydrolase [Marivita sp. S6314]|uniref:L-2-amino-thiazoline-4-carboxylic acid hydrolase n=1 Tax=Marivita sp. S6314 TaxID=2926406 RepID=UPI001FF24723|nr:L-2-amino-thiazoline-4-carboxylic acid hydrolase [Marivita sp. S6314]MCK0150263.1 L-2-amino-thiazoline-4-carboxylic acid hydrolase [Marivita sp. S6314]
MKRVAKALWTRGFLRQIAKAGGPSIGAKELHSAKARHTDVSRQSGLDGFAQFLFETILSTAWVLEDHYAIPPHRSVALLGAALVANGQSVTKGLTALWLKLNRDPFAALQRVTPQTRMRDIWGTTLEAEQTVEDARINLTVTRCGFHDAFWQAGRSDLTSVLCRFDLHWHETIHAANRGVSADRLSSIAHGAQACKFVYARATQADAAEPSKPLSKQGNLL